MEKYLLNTEQNYINYLIDIMNQNLYKPLSPTIKENLINIIKENKDKSIEEILNILINNLSNEINTIITNNITLGTQIGIKNKYFEIELYGGKYLEKGEKKEINENTLFSIDSISKLFTSTTTINAIRNTNINLNTKINQINKEYNLDTTIESILKFTSCIKTEKRIDNLSSYETIKLLKECKELLEIKKNYQNFYEYSDIGYMILRQNIPNFLNTLDNILKNTNITYNNKTNNITGGKINEENTTPDQKGRDIIFPGHTGLYSNILSLINFIEKLITTESLLTNKEKDLLWKQPYQYPYSYNKITKEQKCINKISGIYKVPNNISPEYDKLKIFDTPNQTTINSISSAGTCGSWIMHDNLKINNLFNYYTTGILTNPYSYVENKQYENEINDLNNTELKVYKKGKIIHYSRQLNPYKEILVSYSLLLELLTEYFKKIDNNIKKKTLIKEI